jgi:hypothetical protein
VPLIRYRAAYDTASAIQFPGLYGSLPAMKAIARRIYGLRVYIHPRIRAFLRRSVVGVYRVYRFALTIIHTGVWWWKRWTNRTDGTVFYVDRPMHYAMFAAIHAHLPDVRVVPLSPEAKDYLDRQSVRYYAAVPYPDMVIVTDYGIYPHYPAWGTKAVQIFHGVGGKNYIERNNNRTYLCLVPGRNMKDRLERRKVSKSRIVGYPKTDCFFDGTLDRVKIIDDLSLDRSRKTILYAPSWGSVSSAPIAYERIGEMTDAYNVIVKLHDLSEPEWRDRYRRIDRIRFVEDPSIVRYMFAADLMISDVSSTIFEYAQLMRPIITIITDLKEAREKAWDFSRWEITRMISDLSLLRASADELLGKSWSPSPQYREVVDSIFSYRDGKSALRAAEAIREYMNQGILWKR